MSVLATMPPTPRTSIDQVAKPISIDQMVKTTALTTWSSLGPILKDNGRASPFCRRIASLKIIGASELVVVVGGGSLDQRLAELGSLAWYGTEQSQMSAPWSALL